MDMGGQDRSSTLPRRRGSTNLNKSSAPPYHSNKHNRSLTSHITTNVTGLTSSLTSNLTSNLASNLTGRTQPPNFNLHNNTPPSNYSPSTMRRGSVDCRMESASFRNNTGASMAGSRPLTMNHLLRGKTALTSKTKRVVARGLVAVPPAAKKMDCKKLIGSLSPHHPQPPVQYNLPHIAPLTSLRIKSTPTKTSPKSPKPIIPAEHSFCSPKPGISDFPIALTSVPPETLLWKDALRQRRASLPSGVKLLEGTGRTGSLPATVGEEGSEAESYSNSTSTELCDDEDGEIMEVSELPIDPELQKVHEQQLESSCWSSCEVLSTSSDLYECPNDVGDAARLSSETHGAILSPVNPISALEISESAGLINYPSVWFPSVDCPIVTHQVSSSVKVATSTSIDSEYSFSHSEDVDQSAVSPPTDVLRDEGGNCAMSHQVERNHREDEICDINQLNVEKNYENLAGNLADQSLTHISDIPIENVTNNDPVTIKNTWESKDSNQNSLFGQDVEKKNFFSEEDRTILILDNTDKALDEIETGTDFRLDNTNLVKFPGLLSEFPSNEGSKYKFTETSVQNNVSGSICLPNGCLDRNFQSNEATAQNVDQSIDTIYLCSSFPGKPIADAHSEDSLSKPDSWISLDDKRKLMKNLHEMELTSSDNTSTIFSLSSSSKTPSDDKRHLMMDLSKMGEKSLNLSRELSKSCEASPSVPKTLLSDISVEEILEPIFPVSPWDRSEVNESDRSFTISHFRENLISCKNLSLDSPKFAQQSPTTLSRSSSVSKRSRSSSSISPRSPRMALYDDDSSLFEICKEAESIRQYIDSEFLSNLLLRGEREKIRKKSEDADKEGGSERFKSALGKNVEVKPIETSSLLSKLRETSVQRSELKTEKGIIIQDEETISDPTRKGDSKETAEVMEYQQADESLPEQIFFESTVADLIVSEIDDANQKSSSVNEIDATGIKIEKETSTTKKTVTPLSLVLRNKASEIRIESSDFDEDIRKRKLLTSSKSKSDPSSPHVSEGPASPPEVKYYPISNMFSLTTTNLDHIQVSSPVASPSPSPTFSRSSFALNSQFLKSLSASTQDLLNSLAISSSSQKNDYSPSPTGGTALLIQSEAEPSEIELALPTLAPTTSLAICKLFSAAEKMAGVSNSEKKYQLTRPVQEERKDVLSEIDNSSMASIENAPAVLTLEKNPQADQHLESSFVNINPQRRDKVRSKSDIPFRTSTEVTFRPITPESFFDDSQKQNIVQHPISVVDEDILMQERALYKILDPRSTKSGPLSFSEPLARHYPLHNNTNREVPSLQELASASLPSARPVSSAIISFSSYDETTAKQSEKTHLNRRYNSPEYRKTPSPRLSLRDKFERDLHSKPRHKHSKSLSKNARFQKGPNVRVNSQENTKKTVSKLDKSKSESRIGDTISSDSIDFPMDERVKSEGSLEAKRQTTVKFAPLNIEIPNYREPENEIEDPVLDYERTSDGEEFTSPSDEITTEMIRKRLWAGLRSFSVDADILQAYGILVNPNDSGQEGILQSLSENPVLESETDTFKPGICPPQRKTSMTAEDLEFLETKRNTRRRGSVAALQELVKENTQIINRIVKQKLATEKEGKKSNGESETSQGLSTLNFLSESENFKTDTGAAKDKRVPQPNDDASVQPSAELKKITIGTSYLQHKMTTETRSDEVSGALVVTSNSSNGTLNTSHIRDNNNSLLDSMKFGKVFSSVVTVTPNKNQTTEISLAPIDIIPTASDVGMPSISPIDKKQTIVVHKDVGDDDSGCFKLPLSAFCVNASRRHTQIVDHNIVVELDQSAIVTQSKVFSSRELSSTFSTPMKSVDEPHTPALPESTTIADVVDSNLFPSKRTENPLDVGKIDETTNLLSSLPVPYISSLILSHADILATTSEGNLEDTFPSTSLVASNKICPALDTTEENLISVSSEKDEPFTKQEASQLAGTSASCNVSPMVPKSLCANVCTRAVEKSDQTTTLASTNTFTKQIGSFTSCPSVQPTPLLPKPKLSASIPPSEMIYQVSSKSPSPRKEIMMDILARPITFNPFPIRNSSQHKKEVTLKLGLYSPSSK